MVDHGWSLPDSPFFQLRDSPEAGRGIFARVDLRAGTHLLTTSSFLSPLAHVILRQYRHEVCAYCFAYDRGREWKIRQPFTALSFCSQRCFNDWNLDNNHTCLQALRILDATIQRQSRQHDSPMEVDSEKELTWDQAALIGTAIVQARSASKPSKRERKLLAEYTHSKVDPDILGLLMSGCLMVAASEKAKIDSLMELADNPSVYDTASLDEHARGFLLLLAVLPEPLLPQLRADVSHELISRASHNAFSIRPSSDGEQSGEFLGYGVWPEASLFNHSCRPNVMKERIGRQWSFRVARDVAAGEELCITYLGGDEKDLDVFGRRKRLQDEWGFTCQCQGCVEEAQTS